MGKVNPSDLANLLSQRGYNPDLSAPLIANTYLRHRLNNEPLPRVWEKTTITDAKECYNKLERLS